jgi:hypothetical protein
MTNLPASDAAFEKGQPEATMSLEQALKPSGAAKLSAISGVILMACMFGRNLLHLHRPTPDEKDDDLNGEFWRRHRRIEGILSHTSLSLPDHLRLPAGLPDPNVIFMNMAIHTSVICLHQAAIFKADKFKLPANVGSESRVRCVTAAAEIARIMRMLSHLDLSTVCCSRYYPLGHADQGCHVDEPIPRFLSLCSSPCIRSVFEISAEG